MLNETRNQTDSQDKMFICTNSSNGYIFTIFKQNQYTRLGQVEYVTLDNNECSQIKN